MTTEYILKIKGKSIAENIQILRKENNMTQQQLAEKLDVSKSIISAYEKGKRKPSLNILFKMSEIFGVSVAEMMSVNDFQKNYDTSDLVDISKLTPVQKNVIIQMVKGFMKENLINNKEDYD